MWNFSPRLRAWLNFCSWRNLLRLWKPLFGILRRGFVWSIISSKNKILKPINGVLFWKKQTDISQLYFTFWPGGPLRTFIQEGIISSIISQSISGICKILFESVQLINAFAKLHFFSFSAFVMLRTASIFPRNLILRLRCFCLLLLKSRKRMH